jgi:hypothetical protein
MVGVREKVFVCVVGLVSLGAVHDGKLCGNDRTNDVLSVAGGCESFVVVDGKVERGEDAKDKLARGTVDVLVN